MFGDVLDYNAEDEDDDRERSIDIGNQDMMMEGHWEGRTGMLKSNPKRKADEMIQVMKKEGETVRKIRMMKKADGGIVMPNMADGNIWLLKKADRSKKHSNAIRIVRKK